MSLASLRTSLYRRHLERQVASEATLPLDQAHYVSVSTGRLEPYLRLLATTPIAGPDAAAGHTNSWMVTRTPDNCVFIQAWASLARARLARLTCPGAPAPSSTSAVALIDAFIEAASAQRVGLLLDAGRPTELSIEPHNITRIRALAQGQATADAFSAIGAEQLVAATSPLRPDAIDLQLCDLLDQDQRLLRANVTLQGLGGATWPVYFLQREDGSFPPLQPPVSERLAAAATPARVLVNPAHASWQRDLLWDFRLQAQEIASH